MSNDKSAQPLRPPPPGPSRSRDLLSSAMTTSASDSASPSTSSESSRLPKRPRLGSVSAGSAGSAQREDSTSNSDDLTALCTARSWSEAELRARSHPSEASYTCKGLRRGQSSSIISTPLALACRHSAPFSTVAAILGADPAMIRRSIPSRGTPLHEAVIGGEWDWKSGRDSEFCRIIRLLLDADEAEGPGAEQGAAAGAAGTVLSNTSARAALAVDVDGSTPLHLLVRRCFSSPDSILASATSAMVGASAAESDEEDSLGKDGLLITMAYLIRSSPSAVGVPDQKEYEETPLVATLKATVYAAGIQQSQQQQNQHTSNHQQHQQSQTNRQSLVDSYHCLLENRIYSVVRLMLQSYPQAANHVAISGYGNTAIHSALFHGRCCDTIRLIIRAASISMAMTADPRIQGFGIPAAACRNTLGETALHFACMRNECARSIALIAKACPLAVVTRENTTDLTPPQWLWVRFIDAMLGRLGRSGVRWSDLSEWDGRDDATFLSKAAASNASETPSSKMCVRDLAEHEPSINGLASTSLSDCADVDCAWNGSKSDAEDSDEAFDAAYFARTRLIDPAVDFIRMRHVPVDVLPAEGRIAWRVAKTLQRLTQKHETVRQSSCPSSGGLTKRSSSDSKTCPYASSTTSALDGATIASPDVIEEQATSLFWTKAVSLLRCAALLQRFNGRARANSTTNIDVRDCEEYQFFIVHTAASTSGIPVAFVRLAAFLHSEQLTRQDDLGRTPLHHGAMRTWHGRELFQSMNNSGSLSPPPPPIPFSGAISQSPGYGSRIILANQSLNIIKIESFRVIKFLLASNTNAASVQDCHGRLPLHYAIETAVTISQGVEKTLSQARDANGKYKIEPIFEMLDVLIQSFSESLEQWDGVTRLLPFMMPPAIVHAARSGITSSCNKQLNSSRSSNTSSGSSSDENGNDDFVVSLSYHLLRQNPALVNCRGST